VRTFKNRPFARFAAKAEISARQLVRTAEAAQTKPDAELGGGLVKQRIARKGGGKSGGYRTFIVLRRGDWSIFVHGFAKKDAANVTKYELAELKKLARFYLGATEDEFQALIDERELMEEVFDDDEEDGQEDLQE
jgi:hypothetical protein